MAQPVLRSRIVHDEEDEATRRRPGHKHLCLENEVGCVSTTFRASDSKFSERVAT